MNRIDHCIDDRPYGSRNVDREGKLSGSLFNDFRLAPTCLSSAFPLELNRDALWQMTAVSVIVRRINATAATIFSP